MLRSLMTAVTGVRAHQVMLDVTGNNIANVNTTGFKKDFTIFQDLLYQTSQGATGPGDARGGINPAQVGLGVKVGAIETIHSQGYAQYTGNKSDMMISGEGYFVLRDGSSRLYSRAGNFTLDAEKNLVHSGTGYKVQGYKMISDPLNPSSYIMDGDISDIRIPMGDKLEARATTIVGFRCNLDSRAKSYLPIGYAEIPFDRAGYDTKASVKINDINYKVSFTTWRGPIGDSYLTSTPYLTVTFDSESAGQVGNQVELHMDGIKNGMPVFSLNATSITLYGRTPPTTADVVYNNDTGALKIQLSGATIWETNLHQNMSYASFTITDKSGPVNYNCIAEFDETALDGSPTKLTIYAQDRDSGDIYTLSAMVSFNSDGTFDSVTDLEGTFPPNFNADNLKIGVSANGSGLEIRVAKDLLNPGAIETFETSGTILQGGFHQTKITVYDCQGFPYTLEVQYKKITANHWRWEAFFVDEKGNTMGNLSPTPSSGELFFDESCHLKPPYSVDIDVPFSLLGRENSTITLDFGGQSFGLDVMQGVTQFASESTTKGYYQDGYAMGVLYDWSVGKDGTIVGRYTNDQNMPLYRVALAQFANPMGLDKVGDTMFRETVNSGSAVIDAAATNGAGTIDGGALEMSNVDLTEEFTRLIIAQRGFQANTRVVTTADHILEEVVNLKR